jgi:hypothetical protein
VTKMLTTKWTTLNTSRTSNSFDDDDDDDTDDYDDPDEFVDDEAGEADQYYRW